MNITGSNISAEIHEDFMEKEKPTQTRYNGGVITVRRAPKGTRAKLTSNEGAQGKDNNEGLEAGDSISNSENNSPNLKTHNKYSLKASNISQAAQDKNPDQAITAVETLQEALNKARNRYNSLNGGQSKF